MKQGDVILEVGSASMSSASDAQGKLSTGPHDKPLGLRIVREGHGIFIVVPAGNN